MQDQSKGSGRRDPTIVERSIVLELLREDHQAWWSRVELERELRDVDSTLVGVALSSLQGGGVVELDGERMRATRCTRHLDALAMICI